MSERYIIEKIAKKDNGDFDVVFIHGLGGDKFTTWQNSEGRSWQDWLVHDNENMSVWTIGYGANKTNWIEDDMSLDDTAGFLLGSLQSKGIGEKPYMFIVHSLGGLLVKKILLKAQISDEYENISTMCKSIIFFGVPHNGAGWASLFNYAQTFLRTSDVFQALSKDTNSLHQLALDFNTLVRKNKINTYVFYETKEIRAKGLLGWLHLKKGIKVVSQQSATQVHSTNTPVAVHQDHISMCKLEPEFYQTHILPIMKKEHPQKEKEKQSQQESNNPNNISNTTTITQTHSGKGDNIGGNKIVNNNGISIGGNNTGAVVSGDANSVTIENNERKIDAKNYFEKIDNNGSMNFD